MSENQVDTTESGKKQTEPRVPRSIRFSGSEWHSIEKVAKARGMTAAELVRHAAMGFADRSIAPAPSHSRPRSPPRSSASTVASICFRR